MAGRLFWEKIKDRRIEKDLTQKFLSEKFNINLNTIKGLETGRTGIDMTNEQTMAKFKSMIEYLGFTLEEVYQADFRNTKVLCVLNNKGGCGKTSVIGNLGYALSELDNKILMVDADMQSNLTNSFGLDTEDNNHLGTALLEEKSLENYIVKTEYENIDFVKADLSMSSIDMDLFTKKQRESILSKILKPVIDKGLYDYVLFDTNPTLAILNFNVLNASNYVLIPVQMNSFGLNGLVSVTDFIDEVKQLRTDLSTMGIVINNYDIRKSITTKSESILRESSINTPIMKTIVKVDTTMEYAQFNREPVIVFNKNSRIAKEFKELAKEVLNFDK